MNKLLMGSVVGTLGVLFAVSNIFAATTVSGNGAHSKNHVVVNTYSSTSTSQTNLASFSNGIGVTNKTGHNKANNNTDGSVTLSGGGATTDLTINNVANSNTSTGNPSCACPCVAPGDVNVTGNGADSSNQVKLNTTCINELTQTNSAEIVNSVSVTNTTGGNRASGNTGGDVMVTSGDASTALNINNAANTNTAN